MFQQPVKEKEMDLPRVLSLKGHLKRDLKQLFFDVLLFADCLPFHFFFVLNLVHLLS